MSHSLAFSLALCAALIVEAAAAAELPSRRAPAAPEADAPAAKTCWIDGRVGVLLPGSQTCLRISGAVRGQAAFGDATPQSRQKGAR